MKNLRYPWHVIVVELIIALFLFGIIGFSKNIESSENIESYESYEYSFTEIKNRFRSNGEGVSYSVVTDTKTGVVYLVARKGNDGIGITPLIDKDGKPLLNKDFVN